MTWVAGQSWKIDLCYQWMTAQVCCQLLCSCCLSFHSQRHGLKSSHCKPAFKRSKERALRILHMMANQLLSVEWHESTHASIRTSLLWSSAMCLLPQLIYQHISVPIAPPDSLLHQVSLTSMLDCLAGLQLLLPGMLLQIVCFDPVFMHVGARTWTKAMR